MECVLSKTIENEFSLLPAEEKVSVITCGIAVRLSDLNKRLFLAESKIRFFQEKYHTTLSELEINGLSNDADYEMHEDYIIWHHWTEVAEKMRKQITSFQIIAQYGILR